MSNAYLHYLDVLSGGIENVATTCRKMSDADLADTIVGALIAGDLDVVEAINRGCTLPVDQVLQRIAQLPPSVVIRPDACVWLARFGSRNDDVRMSALWHLMHKKENLMELKRLAAVETSGPQNPYSAWLTSKLVQLCKTGSSLVVEGVSNALSLGADPEEGAITAAEQGHAGILILCLQALKKPTPGFEDRLHRAWGDRPMPDQVQAAIQTIRGKAITQVGGNYLATP